MATIYEIPLTPSESQKIAVSLNTITYNLTFKWLDVPEGGWVVNIADNTDEPIVSGVPLVTGTDLLGQYQYLGINGALVVQTDGAPDVPPVWDNLGSEGHLYYITVP